jgi:phosphoenolpyruvate synthase/pyruvate phosphate dikinase
MNKRKLLNVTGMCVSSGIAKGILRFYQKSVRYKKGDIVLLNEWVTSNVAYLKNAGGLISSKGGLTCHASIIAREYGIPCMVAVKNFDKFKEGLKLELNATAETITLL